MPAVPVGHHPVTNSKYCTAPETVDGDLRGCTQKETYESQSYSLTGAVPTCVKQSSLVKASPTSQLCRAS